MDARCKGGSGRHGVAAAGWLASLIASLVLLLSAAPAQGANGALFGLWAGTSGNEFGSPALDQTGYLPSMVQWQGNKKNDVINVYEGLNTGDTNSHVFNQWLPKIWDDFHSVPMISLNTTSYTKADLQNPTSGPHQLLVEWANALSQWVKGTPEGRRVYIRLNWEGNMPWYEWGGPWAILFPPDCTTLANREQAYVDVWRYVRDFVMGAPYNLTSDQVQWVYSVYAGPGGVDAPPQNCTNGASDIIRRQYPGDQYVDWTGIDGYSFAPTDPAQQPATIFNPWISRLQSIAPTKPISVNEVGVTIRQGIWTGYTPAQENTWISSYFNYLKTSPIKMSLWFNVDYSQSDFAVFAGTNTTTGCTFATYNCYSAYGTAIQDPYFIPSSGTGRLLTDAQFQGSF
jgi:hypothetical protein